VLAFHYDIPQQILHRIGISSPTQADDVQYHYTANPEYDVRRSLFKVYRPTKIKIVMLGDSITYEADWNELLSRNDIANRGINADITEGFLKRLPDIYTLNPEVCFIMGGINDIGKRIPVKTIFTNYTNIIRALEDKTIRPVIQSTLHISTKQYRWKEINRRVDELNALLKEYALKNNLSFVDVNSVLSVNGALKSSYTYDGVHLLGSGYDTWKELITKELSKK
jgi:lysophospholipase L1-like esterase